MVTLFSFLPCIGLTLGVCALGAFFTDYFNWWGL